MINRISLDEWACSLLDIIIPRKCLVCGRTLALREKHLCIHCLCDLPRTYYAMMPRNNMADRFNSLIQRGLQLPGEFRPYSLCVSLFFYRSGYKYITRSLKYHGNIAAGRYFSKLLAEEIAGSALYADVDAVIPVPLHWTRRWSRGYNQAEIIGKVIAVRLGVPLLSDVLVRRRRTRTQTRLSVEKRASNVTGAFKVRRGSNLSGIRHVLLVDDVFTTGATLYYCYRTLLEYAGLSLRISVATLACVGG